MGLMGQKADLPATIVHEILHSCGLKDPIKHYSAEIQKKCGWGGVVGD